MWGGCYGPIRSFFFKERIASPIFFFYGFVEV